MFSVCVMFVVLRLLFFSSSQSITGEPGVQGLLGSGAISFSCDGHSGKSRGHEISAKRPDRNTAAGGFDCHHSILSLGNTRERSEGRFRQWSGTEVESKYGKGFASGSMRVS